MKQDFSSLHHIARTARQLNARNGQIPFSLVLMTDQIRLPDALGIIGDLPDNIAAHTAVIFRDYRASNREILGQKWRRVTALRNIPLIIAGDPSLAVQLKADGFHLPQWLHNEATALRARFPDHFMTASCHSEKERDLLDDIGLTATIVSPIFQTESHPLKSELGPARLTKLIEECETPTIGLGGINQHTFQKLENMPLSGVAGISLFKT